jgi:phage gp29-like protein
MSGEKIKTKGRSGKSRFKLAPVPNGESASYVSNPFNQGVNGSFLSGNGVGTIVLPSDALIMSKGGTQALNLYQNLFLDEQVQACFSKLVQEITSRPYTIIPYSEKPGDLAVAEFVEATLEQLPMDDIFRGLAEALIMGFAVGEVMWRRTNRGVIPYDVRMRDQRRFVFEESEKANSGFSMRCLTLNEAFSGMELPERKFIAQKHWVHHNGDPYGFGLGRSLYPLVKFRRRAIESYVLFGDRFAVPTTVAIAPLSATQEDIDDVYSLISNLSQETALVLPEGWGIESISPSGNSQVFSKLIEYIDKQISVIICGENEAGQAEAGSRASSQVANLVRTVRAAELSENICHKITYTLIRWIVDLNYGTQVSNPTIHRNFRIEESNLSAADLSILKDRLGVIPTRSWIESHFRVELDENADQPEEETEQDPEAMFQSLFGNQPEEG